MSNEYDCMFDDTGAYTMVIFKSGEKVRDVYLCDDHFENLKATIRDALRHESECALCRGKPLRDVEISNKEIGDYEKGEGRFTVSLCDDHYENIFTS